MPLDKIGINFDGLNNIPEPNFNISNTTQTFIEDLPQKANNITGGHLGTVILAFIFSFLYWKLSDISVEANFRFSKLRALALASGIAGVVGMFMFNVGYYVKLYPIIFFITIFMILLIIIVKEER